MKNSIKADSNSGRILPAFALLLSSTAVVIIAAASYSKVMKHVLDLSRDEASTLNIQTGVSSVTGIFVSCFATLGLFLGLEKFNQFKMAKSFVADVSKEKFKELKTAIGHLKTSLIYDHDGRQKQMLSQIEQEMPSRNEVGRKTISKLYRLCFREKIVTYNFVDEKNPPSQADRSQFQNALEQLRDTIGYSPINISGRKMASVAAAIWAVFTFAPTVNIIRNKNSADSKEQKIENPVEVLNQQPTSYNWLNYKNNWVENSRSAPEDSNQLGNKRQK